MSPKLLKTIWSKLKLEHLSMHPLKYGDRNLTTTNPIFGHSGAFSMRCVHYPPHFKVKVWQPSASVFLKVIILVSLKSILNQWIIWLDWCFKMIPEYVQIVMNWWVFLKLPGRVWQTWQPTQIFRCYKQFNGNLTKMKWMKMMINKKC